jgi:hypothetical protein
MTDFVNLKIKSAQSFGCAPMNSVCVYIHKNEYSYIYISIYVYSVFIKKIFRVLHPWFPGTDFRSSLCLNEPPNAAAAKTIREERPVRGGPITSLSSVAKSRHFSLPNFGIRMTATGASWTMRVRGTGTGSGTSPKHSPPPPLNPAFCSLSAHRLVCILVACHVTSNS